MQLEFDYVTCASSEWKEGSLLIQPDALGSEGTGDGGNAGAETLQPLGIYARPDDPSDGKAAGCLVGRLGDQSFAMPLTDPRGIDTVPNGPKGSLTIYCPKNDVTSYLHFDGGADQKSFIQLLLKYGSKSLSLNFSTTTEGQENIQIRHGEGHGIAFTGDKKTVINSSNGAVYIELNDTKIVLNGDVQVNGGLMLGGQSGQPIWTTTDGDALKTAIIATIAGLKDSLNVLVTSTVPLVAVTPGSPKVSASIT